MSSLKCMLVAILACFLFALFLSCSETENPIIPINNSPEVTISNLASGYLSYYEGETVSITGFASDSEDGELLGDLLVWSSDYDGLLGYGPLLETDSLSVNAHLIIFTATDSYGAVGADTINVAILPVG